MVLQVRTVTDLFDKPNDPSSRATIVAPINEEDQLQEITKDGNWIKVKARLPTGIKDGFVRAADVVEVTDPKPVPVDLFQFVEFCTAASEAFNQRQATASVGVSRDYILALALVLNGLEDKGLTDEALQAFDPFHFTEAEWKEFCESSGNTSNYRDFDRFDPLAQIDAAVFFTFRSTSEIDRSLTNPVDPAGPYIPNSMDLFLVHMLGLTAGVKALHDRTVASSGGLIPWASFVGAGELEALKMRYPKFLGVAEAVSVDQLLDLIEKAFDKAYVNVAKIVPDDLPEDVPQEEGEPQWLKIAKDEQKRPGGVREPDQRILDYFKATDFASNATSTTSWCGAFAAFCMKSSGMPVPKMSAQAARWATWGKQLCSPGTPSGQIPAGAVVVFSPSPGTTGSSGHVAFFIGGDLKQVQVLGGNQHDSLKESNFPRHQILHIRWPKDEDVPPSAGSTASTTTPISQGAIAIGPFTAEDWEKFRFVLGKRESGNNYKSVNSIGFCGRWQFGAGALMDAGYVRGTRSPRKLGDANFWTGKDRIFSRDHWCNNPPVQDNAMLEYTRAHYKQLVKMHVIMQGDPKSRVAGLLGAAHLVGVGGARDFAKGMIRHDANGTTAKEYFDLLASQF